MLLTLYLVLAASLYHKIQGNPVMGFSPRTEAETGCGMTLAAGRGQLRLWRALGNTKDQGQ
ncbi:hypothetical protein N183_04895 [Sinorhizobium sp. Sb3]|nr:hypothetical protein N183_04895 [Sinorhizobium sp. Sb3]